MSNNSGVIVLIISNHSPDYSLNCTPLSPITITNCVNDKILECDWLLTALIYSLIGCFRSKLSNWTCPITDICNSRNCTQLSPITITNCVNNKILEYDWLLTALIYSLIGCFRSKLSNWTCPITNICNSRNCAQLSPITITYCLCTSPQAILKSIKKVRGHLVTLK